MATKPEARQEPSPESSLDDESWTRGGAGAAAGSSSPQVDRKAPRAEPEEDIDPAEPGGEEENLQEHRTFTPDGMDGAVQEHEEPRRIGEVTEIERSESIDSQEEESHVQSEDVSPPPPLSDFSLEEREASSSMEREAAEWTGDAEITSDPEDDFMSPESAECAANPSTGNMTEGHTAEDELSFSADDFSGGEPEDDSLAAVHNRSGDARGERSPRFADESEGEDDVNAEVPSCQQQQASPGFTAQDLQPWCSVSVPTQQPVPAGAPAEQQEALPTQSRPAPVPAPGGGNQEAAQQVRGQSSPPLSAVSIEVSNQGGAASVVAARERQRRAGERTEGEGEQTGGEEGQKERALERGEAEPRRGRERSKAGKATCAVCRAHGRRSGMESDSCDDSQSDSGVSADFSPCSTLEGNTTVSTGAAPSGAKETPIEREIRRAVEREHSLRRSRGLPNPPASPEYVDIPLRTAVLSQSPAASHERHRGKDRQLAGKKMQHDIHRETQREQDLVRLGKVPGFYDKGTVRQIKDRKQIFEVFQKPSDSGLDASARSKATSWSPAGDGLVQETQEDVSSQAASNGERRRSVDPLGPAHSNHAAKQAASAGLTPRGPGFSEATACQVIILENHMSVPALKLYHAQQEAELLAVDSGGTQGAEEATDARENPFFKLRPSTNVGKVEQEIREAQEREKELREQRSSAYGGARAAKGGGRRGEGPASVRGRTPGSSPPSANGPAAPDSSSSSSRGGAGSAAARPSLGRLGVWPPAQAEEEHAACPEVVQSPRPPRKKSPLVHRWESGLVNVSEQDH